MQFMPKVTSLLTSLGVGASQRQEAGQCLSGFDNLSAEQKKIGLSPTIETIFPIVFADEAAIQSSGDFQDLRQKPWQVSLDQLTVQV
jgi:hypothetical protein